MGTRIYEILGIPGDVEDASCMHQTCCLPLYTAHASRHWELKWTVVVDTVNKSMVLAVWSREEPIPCVVGSMVFGYALLLRVYELNQRYQYGWIHGVLPQGSTFV